MNLPLKAEELKKQFPIFNQQQNEGLIYLDSAATTHKPLSVLDANRHFYETVNANAHRGSYKISEIATEAYENVRQKVADFIGAPKVEQIIFTKGTTEAINTVAYGWGNKFINAGDEIVVTEMEHHSNLIPWQMLAKRSGAKLRFIEFDENGELKLEQLDTVISPKTKLVAVVYASNALGTINPIKKIIMAAHKAGAKVLIDGAQATPHMQINVTDLDTDFYAFSGHKLLAPMGTGVLYGKEALLNEMDPALFGGQMINDVDYYESTWSSIPWKFEAGTQNVGGVIGLGAAIDFLNDVGIDNIKAHDALLTEHALNELQKIDDVRIFGPLKNRGAAVSFNVKGIHAHDLATFLDQKKIAVRSGHHCAKLVMKKLKVAATARASFYLYNSLDDVDKLISAIHDAKGYFAKWL